MKAMYKATMILAVLSIATGALGADPEYYVKKGSWRETLDASREALRLYLSKPGPKKPVGIPQYGPWFEIGPYSGEDVFKQAFLPEKQIDLSKGDGKRKWKRIEAKDGAINSIKQGANEAVYLHRTITADRRSTVMSYYGSDDGIAVWLNGKKLISHDAARQAAANQETARLDLKKGANHLLIKIKNRAGGSGWYFSASSTPGAANAGELMRQGLWDLVQRDFSDAESLKQITQARGVDEMISRTLLITEKERERLACLEKEGIVTIRPVALPIGKHLVGKNRHLGWPVGAKVGKTLLCLYHQTLRHHGRGPRQDATSSRAVIVRSTDNGETWSAPMDMRQFGTSKNKRVMGFGGSFGVLGRTVFAATIFGLYRSEDEGKTWTFMPDALTQEQTGSKRCGNFGPRMIIHPEMGLVVPVGYSSTNLDLYYSKDRGVTWRCQEVLGLADNMRPAEPTAIYHDGRIVFVARNCVPHRFHRYIQRPERPCMLVFGKGWPPLTRQKRTNISSYRGPDTPDLDFNPITKRFEAVVSNRSGGALENEKNEQNESTVNLWSMSKEDVYAGRADKWRFEGSVLRLRSGRLRTRPFDPDAFHPGGGVIDKENGVQHIFVYCGPFSTPTGIYRITRTLDTAKLNKAMRRLHRFNPKPLAP